jgi:hypothetical protein
VKGLWVVEANFRMEAARVDVEGSSVSFEVNQQLTWRRRHCPTRNTKGFPGLSAEATARDGRQNRSGRQHINTAAIAKGMNPGGMSP